MTRRGSQYDAARRLTFAVQGDGFTRYAYKYSLVHGAQLIRITCGEPTADEARDIAALCRAGWDLTTMGECALCLGWDWVT